ncbi:MAG: hypothetical protein ABIK96_12060, partial [bacterium]
LGIREEWMRENYSEKKAKMQGKKAENAQKINVDGPAGTGVLRRFRNFSRALCQGLGLGHDPSSPW